MPNFSISNVLRLGTTTLKQSGINQPYHEASLLLQHCLKSPKHPSLLPPDHQLSQNQQKNFFSLIDRRSKNEPFAYLTNEVIFCSNKLYVNKNVLIPRPETEQLVDIITTYLQTLPNVSALNFAEIATGSGAIAISLAKRTPKLKITATDISPTALQIAAKNIKSNKLDKKINLQLGDLLEPFPSQSLNIITANLPYIPSHWLNSLDADIVDYEPKIALDGGSDGLLLIKKLLIQAKEKLLPDGRVFLEVWHEHRSPLTKFVKENLPQMEIRLIKDLANLDRFAVLSYKKG